MQWEYKVVTPVDLQTQTTKIEMDASGNRGWELVGIIYEPQIGAILYFKREIQSQGYDHSG